LIFNPRQTVLLTCRGHATVFGRTEEFDEVLPLDWHSPASMDPPLYAVFVPANAPVAELIRSSRAFCVNFMPASAVDRIIKAGRSAALPHMDKFVAARLTRADCSKLVDCPRVREALGWLECELLEERPAGDRVSFLGRVIWSELPRDGPRPFHLEGERYVTTKEI
jgi:flavin reductase (DIM6/NTAB) family NADH-FMN oxidoreductase RutF